MEFLYDFGLFLAQAVTLVAAVLILLAGAMALGQRQRSDLREGHIEIRNVNEKYQAVSDTIHAVVTDPAQHKQEQKDKKKSDKAEAKSKKKQAKTGDQIENKARLFVLQFDGDLQASATDNLREEISAVLSQAKEGDEILLNLESPGGLVHGYGLAASQLSRIKEAKVPLTVAVDKVAASGGYMMACVADTIVAAPFAVIGSIGVLAQLPNFHKLLKKNDIDFELYTAGEYKRTLTMFGENTENGREKFVEELEHTHDLFKQFVKDNRPALNIDAVATGEVWYGQKALDEGLVDAIQTSDGLIQARIKDWDVYEIRFVQRKNWQEKLGMAAEGAIERAALKLLQRANRPDHI